jgi:hypothetical protein
VRKETTLGDARTVIGPGDDAMGSVSTALVTVATLRFAA